MFFLFFFSRFWAHHANIDRHFETWMHRYTTPMARSNYYYFPSTGFAPGCNLRDVISSNDPFIQLSRKENNDQPYTVKVSNLTVKNTFIISFKVENKIITVRCICV